MGTTIIYFINPPEQSWLAHEVEILKTGSTKNSKNIKGLKNPDTLLNYILLNLNWVKTIFYLI